MNSKDDNLTGAHIWNRMADRYANKPVADQAAYERKLAATSRLLQGQDQVLEIGCGTGTTAIFHAPQVQHVTAIDYSERMIEISQAKTATQGIRNIDFKVSSLSDFSARKKQFDVVLAHSVLHLVPNVPATLKQVSNLLRPGGYFISTTVCMADFFKGFRYINALGKALRVMPYVGVFSHAQLDTWLTQARFEIAESWQPRPKAGHFIIARKPYTHASQNDQLAMVAR